MIKIDSLLQRLKKPNDVESSDQDTPIESPYARYMQDRFTAGDEQKLTPASRDVFLLAPDLQQAADTVGLFNRQKNRLLIRDPCKGETGQLMRLKVEPDSTVLFGNWRGYGKDGYGCYNPARSLFSLWFQADQVQPDVRFIYGLPGYHWIPLIGDWDGDGKDGIGLYDPVTGYFFLRNSLSAGLPDYYFKLDRVSSQAIPLAGDWDGDGVSGVGLYDPLTGLFHLTNHLAAVTPEIECQTGRQDKDAVPLTGDWNGSGRDAFGLYLPGSSRFLLWLHTDSLQSDIAFRFSHKGLKGIPVSLRWAI